MNKVILMGRLTRDPDVRYSAGESGTSVARYTLAVDRRFNKRDGEATADFISCVAFGRSAEFAEKYFHQGLKVVVTGRIQTGSYTNRDGNKVYTTDVGVSEYWIVDWRKKSVEIYLFDFEEDGTGYPYLYKTVTAQNKEELQLVMFPNLKITFEELFDLGEY